MVFVAECVGVRRCPLDRHVGAAHDQLADVIHAMLFILRVSLHFQFPLPIRRAELTWT